MEFKKLIYSRATQVFIDITIFFISFLGAFIIRFEGFPVQYPFLQVLQICPYIVLIRTLCFQLFKVYSISWRYISVRDSWRVFSAVLPVSMFFVMARLFYPGTISNIKLPFGVIIIEFMLVVFGAWGVRLARRLIYESAKRLRFRIDGNEEKRLILVGAGDAGNMVAKELIQRTDLGYDVLGFVDDDPQKFNLTVQGVRVLGNTAMIPELATRLQLDEVIITIANASSREVRRISEICSKARLKVKIIPALFELLDKGVKISKIREININDLLGRNEITFEESNAEIEKNYKNKTIMVVGAGGSIGSELSRQLTKYWPKKLILVDKDENGIYEIEMELSMKHMGVKFIPVITNIKNRGRLEAIFRQYNPDVVFHAAAHKHVPLMESNMSEAVLNNVLGTRNLIEVSQEYKTERFVFISTDKAINPTSVMGTTKRIGEMLIQKSAKSNATRFACVRFGNVIGSRGSVIPLFQKQIQEGGYVTITHPEITRYFMSISEAVQLIIQAGTLGEKGEVFVLDMGQPIKIIDMAKDLIKLSGHSENSIEIKIVGLRPGEKLYEEILVDAERDKATKFRKIFIAPQSINVPERFSEQIDSLIANAQSGSEDKIIEIFNSMKLGYNESN